MPAALSNLLLTAIMRIVPHLANLASLSLTAFGISVISTGWPRILFHHPVLSETAVSALIMLFFVVLFGLALAIVRTVPRALLVMLITGIVSAGLWVALTAADQSAGGPAEVWLLETFGMNSIIAEQQTLDLMALLCGVVLPAIYFVVFWPVVFIVRRSTRDVRPAYLR